MNLIEQLGRYEKALDLFRGCPWDSGTVDVPNPRSKGMLRLDLNDLGYELLEYRRQHNIYEAGDWIVIDSHKPEYQFYQITKDDMGSHWINLVEFRHATPEEIKAGKRLEVNQ